MTNLLNSYAWIIPASSLVLVIWLYFKNNPLGHGRWFMIRRFINWFPLGMTYAFLYMARYNLSVSKNALGDLMPIEDFGLIFGVGTTVYGLAFLINGPLVDKIGGKKGIVVSALGACIANGAMGLVTYLFLHGRLAWNLTFTFTVLYAVNMYFQSYGAVSIIKVKAYWFHVRERGVFGAIFGTLISMGAYFAFDWGHAIVKASQKDLVGEPTAFQSFFRTLFAVDLNVTDATWLVFFIPSAILIFWALMDMIFLKDTPEQAKFDAFDPHDASSDDTDEPTPSTMALLKKIFTHRILLTVAVIEFCSGVLRNGIMQWYYVFAKEIPQVGAEYFYRHWGLLLFVFGVLGGFAGGLISDKLFHSRRGPPAAIFNAMMFVFTALIAVFIFSSPTIVGWSAVSMIATVIGVHSLMSGTAAADFGGRKATATASGVVDGFVYLGSGLQSISIGYLTKSYGWQVWPLFLLPFTVFGLFFAIKMWHALPEATRKYLLTVEKVDFTRRRGTSWVRLRFLSVRKSKYTEES